MTQKKTTRQTKKPKHSQHTIPKPSPEPKITEPQKVNSEPEQQTVQDKQEPLDNIAPQRMTWAEKLNILLLFGLLFVNALVLWFMREDAKLQKRAWIGVETIDIQPIKIGDIISCEIIFGNTGNTPAIDMKQRTYMALNMKDSGILEFFEKDNLGPDIGQSPLAPNAHIRIGAVSEEIMNESIIEAIESDKIKLFLLTKIEYFDIFGILHKTHACFCYRPKIKTFGTYHKYNYMD